MSEVDLNPCQAEHGLGERTAYLEATTALDELHESGVRLLSIIPVEVDIGQSHTRSLDHGQLLVTANIGHVLAEEVDQLALPGIISWWKQRGERGDKC